MEFQIHRTSKSYMDFPPRPCKKAFSRPSLDICNKPINLWFINFKTLEDIVEFSTKESIILTKRSQNYGFNVPEIEIYDGYRE